MLGLRRSNRQFPRCLGPVHTYICTTYLAAWGRARIDRVVAGLPCHPIRFLPSIPSIWNPTGSDQRAWKASAHTHTASSCPTIMTSSWSGLASIQLQQRHSSILSAVIFRYLVVLRRWTPVFLVDLATCKNTLTAWQRIVDGSFTWLRFSHPAAPVEYVRCPCVPRVVQLQTVSMYIQLPPRSHACCQARYAPALWSAGPVGSRPVGRASPIGNQSGRPTHPQP